MEVVVKNVPLCGGITVPASKSDAHRALICASLADRPTLVCFTGTNEDIEATVRALSALGAHFRPAADGVEVLPISKRADAPVLDCGESGSTLRFLLPVAAAVADSPEFSGEGRLPARPIGELLTQMGKNGVTARGDGLPLALSGRLRSGDFELSGDTSSQFISGLLMALPLLAGDSLIRLTTPLESSSYVDMTVKTLQSFGVELRRTESGYEIPGGQRFRSPGQYDVEGDWSGGAYFITAGAIGGSVEVGGLSHTSLQPDRAIAALAKELPEKLDVSGFPDLFPILAVLACGREGETLLCGAKRLRIKESDRIFETARFITELGGSVREKPDALHIFGTGSLAGGVTHSANDHRIAMSAAIAAGICRKPVTICGAEAVNKSFPTFWREISRLGERNGI